MLTKTNIYSVRNYLSGNTDRQQWCRRCPPPRKKFCRRPWMIVLFGTFVLSLIANCLFLSVLLVII